MVDAKKTDTEAINSENKQLEDQRKSSKAERLGAGLFFTLITAFGFLSGFGYSVSATKKNETKNYSPEAQKSFYRLHNDGTELARRALFRSTICNTPS